MRADRAEGKRAHEPCRGLENLKIVERPKPEPKPGEALVRMMACSLNYRDLMVVKGAYNPKMPLPREEGEIVHSHSAASKPGSS